MSASCLLVRFFLNRMRPRSSSNENSTVAVPFSLTPEAIAMSTSRCTASNFFSTTLLNWLLNFTISLDMTPY